MGIISIVSSSQIDIFSINCVFPMECNVHFTTHVKSLSWTYILFFFPQIDQAFIEDIMLDRLVELSDPGYEETNVENSICQDTSEDISNSIFFSQGSMPVISTSTSYNTFPPSVLCSNPSQEGSNNWSAYSSMYFP